jgi:hypothetical protein
MKIICSLKTFVVRAVKNVPCASIVRTVLAIYQPLCPSIFAMPVTIIKLPRFAIVVGLFDNSIAVGERGNWPRQTGKRRHSDHHAREHTTICERSNVDLSPLQRTWARNGN